MKKILLTLLSIIIIFIAIFGWLFLAPATRFSEQKKTIYIYNAAGAKDELQKQLSGDNGIRNWNIFRLIGDKMHIWRHVGAGKYEVSKGSSLYTMLRMFRNGRQAAVSLVINKLRTKEDLAGLLGKQFSTDSAHTLIFLTDNDSLKSLGVDTNTVMTLVIPDTYELKWNSSPRKILSRLKDYQEAFWKDGDRLSKAQSWGLTPEQVYTLASIVEEETNADDEKGNIASVYYNRFKKGMALGADPTIKYALRDFSIKRIMSGHLNVASMYNTYRTKGLPPGPICTPSKKTIDAVLNMPHTSFMYFVADSDFSGHHHFSNSFQEHVQYANKYRDALDSNKHAQ